MVRAPCCEKMGLKKGPWTPEEDQILISYVQRHGHENWRALPKQAGLLRCGKSCRLRWLNYLRPDIKRGNFTKEEEERIISLHQMLGNRWSAIAARLPGRTDNEIKNVWHTHLKKRVKPNQLTEQVSEKNTHFDAITEKGSRPDPILPLSSVSANPRFDDPNLLLASPTRSYSTDLSSSTMDASTTTSVENTNPGVRAESFTPEELPEIDKRFWSEALLMDNIFSPMDFSQLEVPSSTSLSEPFSSFGSLDNDDMEFWLRVYMEAGEFQGPLPI